MITAVFIISGPAVAPWVVAYIPARTTNCTNPTWAEGSPDFEDATVGVNVPFATLGILSLDLGANSANWMGDNQLFTVIGWSGSVGGNINETYDIRIYTDSFADTYGPWNGWDSESLDFTTPTLGLGNIWRYYEITGTSGQLNESVDEDMYYGPEIEAVGW